MNGDAVYAWTITGSSDPGLHISKMELQSPTGVTAVPFADDFFFAQISDTTATSDDFPAGPYKLNAYDSSGAQVAGVDLNALRRPFERR